MKDVLVIVHCESHDGCPTEVVEMPPGRHMDEVFLDWYNEHHGTAYTEEELIAKDPGKYVWYTCRVRKLASEPCSCPCHAGEGWTVGHVKKDCPCQGRP